MQPITVSTPYKSERIHLDSSLTYYRSYLSAWGIRTHRYIFVEVAGFGPANTGVKVLCLRPAWRHLSG